MIKNSLHPYLGLGRLAVVATALALTSQTHAATSQSVGAHDITLSPTPGANFVAAPLHNTPTYEGKTMSISGATLRVTGAPFWSNSQLAPVDGFQQYALIIKRDASANPGNQGDWWYVLDNTRDTVTLTTPSGALAPSVSLGVGDTVEIIKLTTLADLFGTGASYVLNKDKDGVSDPNSEDVIYSVSGTSFAEDIIYHDGSLGEGTEGYYVAGNGPFNGSTVTVGLDEAFFVFRKTTSPAVTVTLPGAVQTSRLSHYLTAGANPIATGFPVGTPIGASNLEASGWLHDADGVSNPADEDVAFSVIGTSFNEDIFFTDLLPGWAVAGDPNDNYAFTPGSGYFFFRKGPSALIWRQAPPF